MLDLNALQRNHHHFLQLCTHFKIPLAELDALMNEKIRAGWKFAILGKLLESRDVSTADCIYIGRTHHGRALGSEEEVRVREKWA